MRNPIGLAYDALDRTAMRAANYGVGVYARRMDETKADLANRMLAVAPFFELSAFVNQLGFAWVLLTGLTILGSLIGREAYALMEYSEKMAKRRGERDETADIIYPKYKKLGLIFFGMGALLYASYFINPNPGKYIDNHRLTDLGILAGFGLRGLSYYVMRADLATRRQERQNPDEKEK